MSKKTKRPRRKAAARKPDPARRVRQTAYRCRFPNVNIRGVALIRG